MAQAAKVDSITGGPVFHRRGTRSCDSWKMGHHHQGKLCKEAELPGKAQCPQPQVELLSQNTSVEARDGWDRAWAHIKASVGKRTLERAGTIIHLLRDQGHMHPSYRETQCQLCGPWESQVTQKRGYTPHLTLAKRIQTAQKSPRSLAGRPGKVHKPGAR